MIPAIIQISNINESLRHRNKQLINGEQQIVFLVKRLQKEFGDNIIIATTNRPEDNDVETIAKLLRVKVYRGRFNDILSRLLGAANSLHAENFIRIYGNYPMVDLEQARELAQEHVQGAYDYSYNEHRDGVVWGTGCDVFRTEVLEQLNKLLKDPYQREMVAFYLQQNKDRYGVFKKEVIKKRPGYKLSYESEKDLKVIRELIDHTGSITNREIIAYLNTHEIISTYNREMPPKEVGIEKLFLHENKVEDILQNGIHGMSYPVSVELTLTNRCNLQCVYCSDLELRERQGKESFLDYDILSRLFEDLAKGGTEGIVFEGGGEPTLHPDFSRLVRNAKENNLAVGLITNGTVRLNEADLQNLEWIRVSLDASNAEEYMNLKGVDCFERVLSDIAHYAQYCNTVGVGYVVTNNNLSDIETLILRLREMNVSYIQLRPVVDAPELLPDEKDLRYLECYRSATFNVIVDGMKENMESGNGQLPCIANSLTSVISGDGSVFLCGRLNIYDWFNPIGNIRTQRFFEIWNGEERKRQLNMVGNVSFCSKNCPQCRISKFNMLFHRLSQTKSVHFI